MPGISISPEIIRGTSSVVSATKVSLGRTGVKPTKFVFAVSDTGSGAASGDYFTALELGTALQTRYGCQIDFRPKGDGWYDLTGIDLLVAMVEDYELPAIRNNEPGLITIAWARNWFERWCEHPWISSYDLILASSRLAVDLISQRTGKLARLFRIATNPDRFNSEHRFSSESLDFVFTGHYWQAERDIVAALSALPPRYRGAIYGKHWEQVPEVAYLHRGFIPYNRIHEVYRRAAIVIDDANHVTKDWGATNSRVFDALAAGCLVITNAPSVSDDTFDTRLPVYRNPTELSSLLDHYLKDTAERLRLANELRMMVLARHCYRHRAMEFGLHLRCLRKKEIDLWAVTTTRQQNRIMELPTEPLAHLTLSKPEPATAKPGLFHSISFVVPLFNHLEQTQAMLTSLQASLPGGLDYEIILSDDASTDGTVAWLKTLNNPRIKVVLSIINRGFAATNNAGVRLAEGELLALINNDLLFEPGWLEPMLDILHSPTLKAGLVGNMQYRIADGTLDHAGMYLSPLGQFEHMRSISSFSSVNSCVDTLAVTGACMLLKRATYIESGGLDEEFINGCEDIDLCFKIRASGGKIYLSTKSRIGHHVSLSRKNNTSQNLRNSRHLFLRWRKEIKRSLSEIWLDLLRRGPTAYEEFLQGQLTAVFLDTPNSASLIISEAILRREEAHWSRNLEDNITLKGQAFGLRHHGLQYSPQHGGHLLKNSALFVVNTVAFACNFYVCGRRIHDSSRECVITIDVNGIQQLSVPLEAKQDVNIGILYPITLANTQNKFRVDTSEEIVVTHIVIDDRVIDL